MITRLVELRLTAFRAFRGEQIIPLDADVVLIHGANGSAKTSLLAGLEFALTGEVCDLRAYVTDYPRCLKHLGATEHSSATIRYRDAGGKEREIAHAVATKGGTPRSPFTFTPEEKCFFLERCYLSQSSLSRLLENYQACDSEKPEQPLVRFVRELLGLDLLENLTSGLHEAGNITRIEKSVPPLREARETVTRTTEQVTEVGARRPALATAWHTALTDLQQIAGEVGDAAPESPWDLTGIEVRLKAMDESANNRATAAHLQKLRRAEGRLQSSLGLLGNIEDAVARARLQQQLEFAESTRAGLYSRLENLLARAQTTLLELGLRAPQSDNLGATLHAAATLLGESRDRLEAGARRLAETSTELSGLRARAAEIATALTSHPPSARGEIAVRQRLAELLAAISQHIQGEECPVCRRDYSELNSGALRERIASEIASIGTDAHALEVRERARAAIELENGDIARRIIALEKLVAREQPIVERHAAQRQAVASLVEECLNAEPDRQSLSRLDPVIASFRAELATLDTRRRQRTTAVADLTQLARDIGIEAPTTSTAGEITATITAHLVAAIDKAERQLAGATRLRNALSAARSAGQALAQIDRELATLRHRHEQASALIQRLRGLIQEGKDLAKAATSAKKKLLDQVFNDTLNRLWKDFFRRLAKQERFQPWLGEPRSERGQIRTTIEGRAAIGEPFSQFAAVASSGNMSTAALSLFLALHLIEQPRHRVLVLDDPVQNMDDVHVVQLAGLLREIGRSAQRQIVIAVHERALFDYLCLELSPTQPERKLLALELRRNRPDEAPALISTEHIWQGDRLKFGLAG
jgi:exonuclease SbcC